jgi:hypothetical protein
MQVKSGVFEKLDFCVKYEDTVLNITFENKDSGELFKIDISDKDKMFFEHNIIKCNMTLFEILSDAFDN